MTTQIEDLVDDCLLHVFKFLDPLNWVFIAQVCTRWKQLVKELLKNVSEVHLKDGSFCSEKCLTFKEKKVLSNNEIDADKIKTTLQYIGVHVQSLVLGDCPNKVLYFSTRYEHFCYHITGNFYVEDFISLVSQNCTNIVELKVSKFYTNMKDFYEKLLKSAKKLKKVILPDKNLMLPNRTYDSVEEITLKIWGESKLKNFELLFPNVNKLTVFVRHRSDRLLGSILKRIKHIKSLDLIIQIDDLEYKTEILSYISVLSRLENLRIWNKGVYKEAGISFKTDLVEKLLRRCRKLRIVVLGVNVGMHTVSSFLTLPNLEQLVIFNATIRESPTFNKLESNQCLKLTEIYFIFNEPKSVDLSSLIDAIQKMPRLKYLAIQGLSDEQLFEFICKVITNRLEDNEVIVIFSDWSHNKTIRICKNMNSEPFPEPLRLLFEFHRERFCDKVQLFVQSLENCLVIVNEREVNSTWTIQSRICDRYRYENNLYNHCHCLSREYSSPESSLDDSDSEYDS